MNKTVLVLPLATAVTLSGCSQQPVKPSTTAFANKAPALYVKLRDPDPPHPAKPKKKHRSAHHHRDLWHRLFALYRLPQVNHPRVREELKWYAANPEYLERIQQRARPHLYTIVEEIERHGLPGELALLPVIESAFEPHARSPKQAVGLWQFIPSTGEQYGLKQNQWVDLRQDVHASTRAAIRYLKKLYADFGDWLLALAAYNAGEGRVMQEIVKNRILYRPTDFWHLDLPEETKAYVPKLLAVAQVFKHAEQFGIALHPLPNRPLYARVDVGAQIDLALAARLADMALEEVQRLNPGFRRRVTAPDGPHRLVLPLEKVELFEERLAQLPKSRWTNFNSYPQQARARYVAFPMSSQALSESQARQSTKTLSSANGSNRSLGQVQTQPQVKIHVVRSGETLWAVARRYGMEVRKLMRLNGLRSNTGLRVGQRLRVVARGSDPLRTARWGSLADG